MGNPAATLLRPMTPRPRRPHCLHTLTCMF
ncbi:hypothetical protein E2C01_095937 [Portunus trituberculatus]|uniref:Uncharacterized protein n=1 Tax=Portunus trituberculatus TaxID=210409 RepID=A0A5B7K1G8_PORTR|nr:hypothetical protein [Portunus trituberculatus]